MDSSFIGNSADTAGGAIWTNKDLTIGSLKNNVIFANNRITAKKNDITLADSANLSLIAGRGTTISLNSGINTTDNSIITLDGTGTIELNAPITGSFDVQIKGAETHLENDNYFDNANVTIDILSSDYKSTPTLNLINNTANLTTLNSLEFKDNATLNLKIDVDLAKATSDSITTTEAGSSAGTISLTEMHLKTDAPTATLKIIDNNPNLTVTKSSLGQVLSDTHLYTISVNADNTIAVTRNDARTIGGFQTAVSYYSGVRTISLFNDVVYSKSYINPAGGTSTMDTRLTGTLNIYGNGHSIKRNANKNNCPRIYDTTATNITNIYDTTFNDFDYPNAGAVIYTHGTIGIISNSNFNNSHAVNYDNGARYAGIIYVGSNIIDRIINTTFSDNTTEGGVVYASGGIINSIENSKFENNYSSRYGTVITASEIGSISNTLFEHNDNPEATYNYDKYLINTTNLKSISGSTFSNNTLRGYNVGGLIYATHVGNVINTKFADTTSDINNTFSTIYSINDIDLISESKFERNIANYGGAAIYSPLIYTIEGSLFKQNKSQKSVGAVAGSINLLTTSIFIGNDAATSAGAISGSNLGTISNSLFGYNTASTYGGAITAGYIDLIDGSSFNNNTAATSGGAINVTTLNKTYNGNFSENVASNGNGGAINTNYISIIDGTFFEGNRTSNYGGAISTTYLDKVKNANFEDNFAKAAGGAIYAERLNEIDNTKFTNNMTGSTGGAVNSTMLSSVTNSSFEKNNSFDKGGAIYNIGDTLNTFDNNTFINNVTMSNGGALYNAGSIDAITGNTFIGNTSTVYGGAIYNEKNLNTISNSKFIGNKAFDDGGALTNIKGTIDLKASSFENNIAFDGGGAIVISNNNSAIKINDTENANIFRNNYANRGGAIYYYDTKNADNIIENVLFDNNNAFGNELDAGGAIDFRATNTLPLITNSIFTNNKAHVGFGGAIAIDTNSTIENISNSEFRYNTAYTSGGAIYKTGAGSLINITNTDFIGNTSLFNVGGAISSSATLKIEDSNFMGNRALSSNHGGALSLNNDTEINAISKNVIFADNTGFNDFASDILISADNKTLTLNVNADKTMYFEGEISGNDNTHIDINGDGRIIFVSPVTKNATNMYVDLHNGELVIGNDKNLDGINLTSSANPDSSYTTLPTLNIMNGNADTMSLASLNIETTTLNLKLDADLENDKIDKIDSDIESTSTGNLSVTDLRLLSEGTKTLQVIGDNVEVGLNTNNIATILTNNNLYNVSASGKNLTISQSSALSDGLTYAIQNLNANRSISLVSDVNATGSNISTAGSTTNTLNIFGNGYTILGDTTGTNNWLNIDNIKLNIQDVLSFENFNSTILNNNNGIITNISNTTFANNIASANPTSVLRNHSDGKVITIDNVIFENNLSTTAVINNNGKIEQILNSKFTDNTPLAIYNNGNIDLIYNTTFDNNGLLNDNEINQIYGSEFKNNTATAIQNNATINSVRNTSFKKNDGISISNQGSINEISGSKFAENKQYSIENAEGKTIKYIENSTFKNNTATAIQNSGTINEISGSTFTNNSTSAITNSGEIDLIYHSTFDNSNIENNNKITRISNSNFKNNSSITNNGTIDEISATFDSNAAISINNKADKTIDLITNSTFSTNSDTSIKNEGTISKITNTTFKNNSAEKGAGIYNTGTLNEIKNSKFINNISNTDGGAIYNTSDNLEITDTSFTSNSATNNGGAIYTNKDISIKSVLNDISFKDNSAAQGQDIFLDNGANLNLYTGTLRSITISDGITGTTNSNINIDGYGRTFINAPITSATVNILGSDLTIATDAFKNTDVVVDSFNSKYGSIPTINLVNGTTDNLKTNSFTITDRSFANLMIDIDGANNSSDKITSTIKGNSTGALELTGLHFITDITGTEQTFNIIENNPNIEIDLPVNTTILSNRNIYKITRKSQNITVEKGTVLNGFQSAIQTISKARTISLLDSINLSTSFINQSGVNTTWTGNTAYGDLTIYGNNMMLTGNSLAHITVNAATTLHLYDLSIVTGFAAKDSSGGVIVNNGLTDIISNVSFNENTATNYGGAIYNLSGSIINTIENSKFISNTTTKADANNYGGAAIANIGIINSINNTKFNKNTTVGKGGGAIYNHYNIANISNSMFDTNSSNYSGGAIYNNNTIDNIDNTTFKNNTTNYSGGAIYSPYYIKNISNSTFEKNTAKTSGGALASYVTDQISGSNFTYNETDVYGGAIYNYGILGEIDSTTFEYNKAADGGAIYNTNIIKTINNSIFKANSANSGGAIRNAKGTIELIKGTTFEKNTAKATAGAISNTAVITTIDNTKFISNATESTNAAGALDNYGIIENINNSTFSGNEGTLAGAINNSKVLYNIAGTTFESNKSATGGGAINNIGKIESIETSTFNKNESKESGGAISSIGILENIIGSTFSKNTTEDSAGAIYLSESDKDVKLIDNSTFTGNTSNNNGGAIYSGRKINAIENTTFAENISNNGDGGAIYANNDIEELNNVTFTSNTALNGAGGAIYNNGDIKTISGTFTSNGSGLSGGAIYNATDKTIDTIENSTFNGNYSLTGNGGAIYNNGTINTIQNSTFTGNGTSNFATASLTASTATTKKGGAIYNNNSELTIIDTSFTSNKVTEQGGAIYNDQGTINISAVNQDVAFTQNIAAGTSEAIYNNNGTINFNAANTRNIIIDDVITGTNGIININSKDISDDIQGTILFNNNVENNEVHLYNGTLSLGKDEVDVTVSNLNLHGGKLDIQNCIIKDTKIDSITEAIEIEIDVDFSASPQPGYIGVSDTISGDFAEDSIINLSAINILADSYMDSGLVLFSEKAVVTSTFDAYTSEYKYTFNASDTGTILVNKSSAGSGGFKNAVNSTSEIKSYSVTYDEEVTEDVGKMNGKKLTLYGNQLSLYGNSHAGLTMGLADDSEAQTFVINNIGYFNKKKGLISKSICNFNSTENGGFIYNDGGNISIVKSAFSNNRTDKSGGFIYNNNGTIEASDSMFGSNVANESGGSIYNKGTLNLTNVIFSKNKATTGLGGAIYNEGILNLIASDDKVKFNANTANGESNAIYNTGVININGTEAGTVLFEDKIDGENGIININANTSQVSTVLPTAQTNATVQVKNDILNHEIHLYNGKLSVGETDEYIPTIGAISIYGGTLDILNSEIETINLNKFENSATLELDVDLEHIDGDGYSVSDRLLGHSTASDLNIANMNILTDSITDLTYIKVTDFAINTTDFYASTGNYKYLFMASDTGIIKVVRSLYEGLKYYVNLDEKYKVYKLNSQENIIENIEELNGIQLTVLGKKNGIVSYGFSGIEVGKGKTLNIQDIGSYYIGTRDIKNSAKNFTSTNGAFINNSGTLNITNSIITNNIASQNGGAIYNEGILNINLSEFNSNSAITGGAIYTSNDITLKDTDFRNNTVSNKGGAIYANGNINIIADTRDVIFNNNTITDGITAKANDIFLDGIDNVISLNVREGKTITFDGGIQNIDKYTLLVNDISKSDATGGSIVYNSTLSSAILDLSNVEFSVIGSGNSEAELRAIDENVTLNIGKNTILSLVDYDDTMNNIDNGTFNVDGTLIINNNYKFGNDVILNTKTGSIVQVQDAELNINENDTLKCELDLSGSGIINMDKLNTGEWNINAVTGELNIAGDAVFSSTKDIITSDVILNFNETKDVIINAGSVSIDNNDTWGKNITVSGGSLSIDGFSNTEKTGRLKATSGQVSLNSGILNLEENDSIAQDVFINIAKDTVVNVKDASLYLGTGDSLQGNINVLDDTSYIKLDNFETSSLGYINIEKGTVDLDHTIVFANAKDSIASVATANLTNTTDLTIKAGNVYFDNADNISNAIVTIKGGALHLTDSTTRPKELNLLSGTLDIRNNTIENISAKTINSGSTFSFDVDFAVLTPESEKPDARLFGVTDTITGSIASNATLNLGNIRVLNDSPEMKLYIKLSDKPFYTSAGKALSTKYQYIFTAGTSDAIKITRAKIYGLREVVVDASESVRLYEMDEDEAMIGNLGTVAGTKLTVDTNEYFISGENYTGMTNNAGTELIIKNVGKKDEDSKEIIRSASGFVSTTGGFINNSGIATIDNAYIIKNKASYGGALANSGTMTVIDSEILDNVATFYGGAIYTTSNSTTNIIADKKDVLFSNNKMYTSSPNDIYANGSNITLNLHAKDGKNITLNSGITATSLVQINVNKDKGAEIYTGNININNSLAKAILDVENGQVTFGAGTYIFDPILSNKAKLIIDKDANATFQDYDKVISSLADTNIDVFGQLTLGENITIDHDTNLKTDENSIINVSAGRFDITDDIDLHGTVNLTNSGTVSVNDMTLDNDFIFNGNAGFLNIVGDVIIENKDDNIGNDVHITLDEDSTLTINNGDINIADSTWNGIVTLNNGKLSISEFDSASNKNGTLKANGGELKIENVLTLNDDSYIETEVTTKLDKDSTVNIEGGSLKLNGSESYADTWNGTINLTKGDLELTDINDSTTGSINATSGNLSINKNVTLQNKNDFIDKNVILDIADASTLTVNNEDAIININNNDKWSGKADIQSGTLNIDNYSSTATNELVTDDANLNITTSTINLAGDTNVAKETVVNMDYNSIINLSSGEFTLDGDAEHPDTFQGKINVSDTGNLNLDNISTSADSSINVESGELDISNEVALNNDKDNIQADAVVNVDNTGIFTISAGEVTLNNNDTIDGTINLASGTLTLGTDTTAIPTINELNISGGLFDIGNTQIDSININSLTGNANIIFDIDFSSGKIGDYYRSDFITGFANGSLSISDFNEIGSTKEEDLYIQLSDQALHTDAFVASKGIWTYNFEESDNGIIHITKTRNNTLKAMVNAETPAIRVYDVEEEEDNYEDIGQLNGEQLTVNGKGNSEIGHDHSGIIVGDSKKLILNDLGTRNEGTIEASVQGFKSENGGFVDNAGELSVNKSIFTNNTAIEKGGALNNTGHAELNNDIFESNTAGTYGGAFANSGEADISNSEFNKNTAAYGGAIANDGDITIVDTDFIGNNATEKGGAIYTTKDVQIIAEEKDVTFKDNTMGVDTEKVDNDIYLAEDSKLYLNAQHTHKIAINSGILAPKVAEIVINSNEKTHTTGGDVEISSALDNAAIEIYDGNLNFKGDKDHTANINIKGETATVNIDKDTNLELKAFDGEESNINQGTINISGTLKSGENNKIDKNTTVNIKDEATLEIADGEVDLSNKGEWAGKVEVTSGTLNTYNFNDIEKNGTLNVNSGNVNVKEGSLYLANDSSLAADAKLDINKGASLIIDGTTDATINENDTWNGTVLVRDGEVKLNNVATNDDNGALIANGGTIDITGELTLNNHNDTIYNTAQVNINDASNLTLNNGNICLNKDKTLWNGTVTLNNENANLVLEDFEGNGTIYGNSGRLTLNGTDFIITGDSYISSDVAVNGLEGSSIRVANGGEFVFNNNDVINTPIYLDTDGNLEIQDTYIQTNDKTGLHLADGNLTLTNSTVELTDEKDSTSEVSKLNNTNVQLDSSNLIVANADTNTANIKMNNDNSAINVINQSELTLTDGTNIDGGSIVIGDGTKENSGKIIAQGGEIKQNTAITLTPNSSIDIDGGSVTIDPKDTLANDSIIHVKRGQIKLASINGSFDLKKIDLQPEGEMVIDKSKVTIDNSNKNISAGKITINPDSTLNISKGALTLDNFQVAGTMNSANKKIENHTIKDTLYVGNNKTNTANFIIDISPSTKQVDTYKAGNIVPADGNKNGTIKISNFNVIGNEIAADDFSIKIFDGKNKNITYAADNTQNIGKIGTYSIIPSSQNDGTYTIHRNGYTPGVMAAPIAAQLGGYLTQLAIYEQSFMSSNQLMSLPKNERTAMLLQNTYAKGFTLSGRIFEDNPDQAATYKNNKDVWFRPYGTIEKVDLNEGIKADNKMFGMMLGVDFNQKLRKGFRGIGTPFVGYNYSRQNYETASINQNGVTVGYNETIYKGNFFNTSTLNVAGSFADTSSNQGSSNFPMLMGGVANKTGYNFEFLNGKFIVQPNLQLSYTLVNTFNHTAMGDVNISSKPLNAVQIQPEVKIIGNFPGQWQPYFNIDYVWSLMDKTDFTANDIVLPKLSVNPYFEMGIGIKKVLTKRFEANVQATVRAGGRTGMAFQAGLKYEL